MRQPDRSATRRPRAIGIVLLAGLLTTAALSVASASAVQSNEVRLLKQRVSETSLVLTEALPTVQTSLAAAAELALLTRGDPAAFTHQLAPTIAAHTFTSASLWRLGEKDPKPVVVEGAKPTIERDSATRINKVLAAAIATPTLGVVSLLKKEPHYLGYTYATPPGGERYVVYAETALAKNPTRVVQAGGAFAGVDYAIYFGKTDARADLLAASTDQLPLGGRHRAADVAFGNSSLRLVMKPKGELGGQLLRWLPLAIAVFGVLLSIVFAALAAGLVRRQVVAERLASENADLYADQRSVAQTLQRSLLPKELPVEASVEFGVRYESGVDGIDIGGDWYDIIQIDDQRLLAVVGDVSGRGLGAATVMAALRYAIRAFASQGDSPSVILDKLDGIIDLRRDGHFATVLLAEVALDTRTLTVASAGHPHPLLVDDDRSRFIDAVTGPPVGVGPGSYHATTTTLPDRATVLLFTDGLFERRDEVIDAGLERLRSSANGKDLSLEALLDKIVTDLATGGAHDDTALLGMRWLN